MDKEKILSVINLNKYFVKSGKFVQVLDNITFDVYKNDFFGIIGESGSGKSTTGKCIIRLYDSSSGIIQFDNKIINQKLSKNNKKWLTKNMSMVFQDPMSSLNPKKTILSIIAEPLVINKVIKKDANKIIKTSIDINSYFKLTYKVQDYKLTKQYLEAFYQQAIDLFKQYQQKVNNFTKTQNDLKVHVLDLLAILSEFEMRYKLLIPHIYAYNKEIANLLWINNETLNSRNLAKQEQDYYLAKEKYDEQKKLINHSTNYINLDQTKKQLTATLDEMLTSLKEKYLVQNRDYLLSLYNSLKDEIKINKQSKQLSSSITEFNILQVKIMMANEMLEGINLIKNEKFYNKENLDSFLEYLFQKVNNKYASVFANILTLASLSSKVDNLSTDNNSKEDILNTMNEYNQHYQVVVNEINELAETKKIIDEQDIIDLKNKFIKHCQEIEKDKRTINDFYQSTIDKINEKLTNLDKEYKESQELINNKQKLNEFKQAVLFNKQQRQQLIDSDTKSFNEKWLPLINQQKNDLINLKKEFIKAKKEYQKATKQALNKMMHEFDKHQDDYKYWVDFLKKEIKGKFTNIQAINFELNTYLDEIDTYRSLRTFSHVKLFFLRKPLKNIITRKYVYNALTEVGLKNEHAYRYPHEFSGGQRQRIVIARALIMKPKLVIADEPISALDVSIQAQVVNIMKRLSKEQDITFLFIAHDLSMVHHISNRLIIMHKGRIVEKGDTNDIFANPIHPYTKSLIKASPELSKIHVDLASFSTNLNYDKDYDNNHSTLKFYSVSDKVEHEVFATKEQFEEWTTLRAK